MKTRTTHRDCENFNPVTDRTAAEDRNQIINELSRVSFEEQTRYGFTDADMVNAGFRRDGTRGWRIER